MAVSEAGTSSHMLAFMVKAGRSFSPGAPIDKYRLFAGRARQVQQALEAIAQRGQHLIIYGERGVGKTSLANVLSEILAEAGIQVMGCGTINCDKTDTFSSLWHKILRELQVAYQVEQAGFCGQSFEKTASLGSLLGEEVSPDDVRYALSHFTGTTVLIIDEIDRLEDSDTATLLADTIKTLSDHSVDTTLILVGVGDSVDELIAEHESIERALVQVRMPRMSRRELREILQKGLDELNMRMEDSAVGFVTRLSQGLPHYTHLLGLYSVRTAIDQSRTEVTMSDAVAASSTAVNNAQQSILSLYHKATSSARQTLYAQVLLACALVTPDDLGYFAAADVRGPMTTIMGRPYDIPAFSRHLNDFCEDKRGPVLSRTGTTRRFRFRFINPLMQPFVLMQGIATGLIRAADLQLM